MGLSSGFNWHEMLQCCVNELDFCEIHVPIGVLAYPCITASVCIVLLFMNIEDILILLS